MLDLLVRGGQVVGSGAIDRCDIGVLEGKIALLSMPGVATPEAR